MTCESCGGQIERQATGRPPRYCSQACRARAYRTRHADRASAQLATATQVNALQARVEALQGQVTQLSEAVETLRVRENVRDETSTQGAKQQAKSAFIPQFRDATTATTPALEETAGPEGQWPGQLAVPVPDATDTTTHTKEPKETPATVAAEPKPQMTERKAREILKTARTVKADDWRDTGSRLVVAADGTTLAHIVRAYNAGKPHGWNAFVDGTPARAATHYRSIKDAADAGREAWVRQRTAPVRRTPTGD